MRPLVAFTRSVSDGLFRPPVNAAVTGRRAANRPRRRASSRELRFLLLSFLLARVAPAVAQLQASEPALKAAYLEKFAGFVEWPPGTFKSDGEPFVIGVVDSDPVRDELVLVAPRASGRARAFEVTRVEDAVFPTKLNVLFVSSVTGRAKLVDAARRAHVLVVTADPSGLHEGSALNFVNVDRRLRFEASVPESEREGLKLSSRLLGVALRVEEHAP